MRTGKAGDSGGRQRRLGGVLRRALSEAELYRSGAGSIDEPAGPPDRRSKGNLSSCSIDQPSGFSTKTWKFPAVEQLGVFCLRGAVLA